MTAPGPAPILGIDLGTTMSAVGVFTDGKLTLIENELGETLTPSVVAYDARAKGLVAGRIAKDILAVQPHLAVAAFKRSMGIDERFDLGGQQYSAPELSSYVLDALRADAERTLGRPLDRCVITVPAYFGEAQRQATVQAGELAGLQVERVLNEPTAAAIAYGLHRGEDERTFIVLDLGGGTFDVCVMGLFEGLLEVRSVAGESQLGGEDFTAALRDLALERTGVALRDLSAGQRAALNKRAELLKRRLSRWLGADIRVPTPGGGDDVNVNLGRADAEAVWAPLVDRMLGPCRSALRGAGLAPDALDDVLLVGGATRMPCIEAMAEKLFGRKPVADPDTDPDLAVVRGAAVQAALCADDASVADMVVTDVASHSLGIAVSREVDGRHNSGYFSPIIDRNTVIPTSRVETFGTVSDNQSELVVEVFEGEHRRCEHNRKLGTLEVSDIPSGPSRDVLEVRFTYDLSGILEVEATVLETGKKTAGVFQRGGETLQGEALERATKRLRALKADPAERPRYRDLLGRANGLWADLTGDARDRLSYPIDQFEAALASRHPGTIEKAFQVLRQACERLDGGERW